MKNMKETIERYTSAWNHKTAAEVKIAFAGILAEQITYLDRQTPLTNGIDAFVDMVMSSHKNMPGRTFSLLTEPAYFDSHCYYT